MFQRILVSVSDKTGLVDFIRPFADAGARIVSSGGTAKVLMGAGMTVTEVSDYTGFPECMDGRVKTLHPKVHMGLLYRPDNSEDLDLLSKHEVLPFDLVVANLYPYEAAKAKGETGDDLIEYIDIGGPSLLRAAAKNFKNVCVVCDPSDYQWVARKEESLSLDDRKYLAAKVFQMTSAYDQMIAKDFYQDQKSLTEKSAPFLLNAQHFSTLRYGENPQQKAWWYNSSQQGLHRAQILQGKPLSYNNILDLQAACTTVRLFNEPTAVAIKHNNPCGIASNENKSQALSLALKSDPVSVFGGIVAVNFKVDAAEAEMFSEIFLECIIAPEISQEALDVFAKKKNLRILQWPEMKDFKLDCDFRSIDGGVLMQDTDEVMEDITNWQFIGETPDSDVLKDLHFAWRACAALKSNAISVCKGRQTLGLGMGQVNRVDAVKQALQRSHDFHPQASNTILASDAFFPFPDSVEIAAKNGVKWLIQPGGSVKDEEVIAAAKKLQLNMVLTGRRHFRH